MQFVTKATYFGATATGSPACDLKKRRCAAVSAERASNTTDIEFTGLNNKNE